MTDETVELDTVMLGRFVAQYDEGAAGFFIDAEEAQEVAQQVKAALSLGERIMAEVHGDLTIPTPVACKVYAAIKRASTASRTTTPVDAGLVERLRDARETLAGINGIFERDLEGRSHEIDFQIAKIDAALEAIVTTPVEDHK